MVLVGGDVETSRIRKPWPTGGLLRQIKEECELKLQISHYYYYYHHHHLNHHIIEFLTSQLWFGNVHLSWDVVINRIRLGGLICSLKSFLQLNMCLELQIFAAVYMYWGAS